MYIESHSKPQHVQQEDHTFRQEEFSTSVDEDDFSTKYGEMEESQFHHMMQAQDRKFYQTFNDQIFLFNDICDSQVDEKCDLAVFSKGPNQDLRKERIQSASKLSDWNESTSKFLDSDLEEVFSESEFEDEEVLALSDRGMKISKALTNRVDTFLSDEKQVRSFIKKLEEEEYFTADEDDIDVEFFDVEKSLDSDNEELLFDYGSTVGSQVQAENNDKFLEEICHLIAMTQPEEDDQSIVADIYKNSPKMTCMEESGCQFHSSMEDIHGTEVTQDSLSLSMMQTNEATNSGENNHATQSQVVCDSSRFTANSIKMPNDQCIVRSVAKVNNLLDVQEDQLVEFLDVPSQCSAVSACVGSSSGGLAFDELENIKSELIHENSQDLISDVTEENDEDGIWSILTDNLHYLKLPSLNSKEKNR